MDEWFKARLIWYKGIEALSDAEAGRLAKALWKYAATGEVENLSGGEKFAFAMCMATLEQDVQKREDLSETRSEAGKKGGRPRKANESKKSNCFSEKANESKKSHKEIRYKNNIPPYNPPTGDDDDEEAMIAQNELLNEVFDKARDSGFKITQASMDLLSDRLHDYGKETLFYALDKCVKAQAFNFGYLDTVLGNKPKQAIQAPSKPHDYAADYL